MKKYINNSILAIFLAVMPQVVFAAESAADSAAMEADLGYFYGYSFGNMLRDGGSADVDIDALLRGLKDALEQTPPALDATRREAVYHEVRARQARIQEDKQQTERAQSQANLDQANNFLQENLATHGVTVTSSGLQYSITEDMEGPTAELGDTVVVKYVGSFINGDVFDQSGDNPVEFRLDQVISGWTEGLQLMSVGDKFKLFLHPDLAYGAGAVGRIPPNSLLIFDIELLEIKKPGSPALPADPVPVQD